MKEYEVALSDKESRQGYQLYDVKYKRKIVWTGPAKPLIKYIGKVLKSNRNARNFISYVEKNGSGLIKMDKFGRGKIKEGLGMSDTKKAILMLRICGDSWKVNMGKVFKGINSDKPTMIKRGLKELKILHKRIEEQIEELI